MRASRGMGDTNPSKMPTGKRKAVLNWMDTYMDYGMCLDIPSQSLSTFHIKDPKTGKSAHGISTIEEAISATHINNEYFIKNRNGNCKFLNVLQGRNHTQSDDWYEEMKKYCDPNVYPDNHFNGWAFGGQNKIDVHLMLRRLVNIIHDGLLVEGKHDLIHCLGVSILEYAVLFTDIQRAIRKYHNPKLQITFDCASPFFSAAKGLAYFNNSIEHNKKWAYSMEKTAENKGYANDNRKFSDAVLQDKIHKVFTDSPVTDLMTVKDLCYRGQGFIGQHGKETLARVRGKFSGNIKTPDSELTMDYTSLATEAKDEKTKLIDELIGAEGRLTRLKPEKVMEREALIAENLNKSLKFRAMPRQIYVI